jgi:hypothetical protein
MTSEWHFDVNNPFEDLFEESLLQTVGSDDAGSVVMARLDEIRRTPHLGKCERIGDFEVYVSHIGAAARDGESTPPLFIAYALDTERKLVRPIFVGRAERAELAGALTAAARNAPPPAGERPILAPAQRTTIPEETIKRAVEWAVRSRKRST